MSDTNTPAGGGVGILGLLGVLFIGLKLGHVITWPWLWVSAPFWGGLALFVVVFIVTITIVALVSD